MGAVLKILENNKALVEQAERFNRINQSINNEIRETKIAYNELANKVNTDLRMFNEKLDTILRLLEGMHHGKK